MAGFKGYAISMLIDIIAGALSGAAFLNGVGRFYSEDNSSMNVGYFMMAINPDTVFGDGYAKMINEYVLAIRDSKTAEGQTVSLPGDDRINYRKNREALL
jgi:LDH2 family malate/lactate/ureidoglycolate dehydrogenase